MAIKKLSKAEYAAITKAGDLRHRSPETSAVPVVGTDQQQAIWSAMVDTTKNIAVRARAGTGKTFTMIHGLGLMRNAEFRKLGLLNPKNRPQPRRMAFVAFNRSIRDELKAKVPAGVDASTLHSMGYSLIRRHYGDSGVRYDKHKTANCLREYINNRKPPFTLLTPIEKIVSLCKSYNFTAEGKRAVRPSDLDMLVDTYDIQLYKQRKAIYELVPAVLDISIRKDNVVDYDDMIYLPVVHRDKFIKQIDPYDVLAVDESQDMNIVQQELALLMGRRLIIVGDDRQAIYGFRGADPNAMAKLIKAMGGPNGKNVELLTLTATRRCPTTHVALARQVVDDFESMPDALTGSINVVTSPTFDIDSVLDNDTIIVCRTNAPLIKKAFQLIAKNIRCRIQGRDFSAGIVDLVKQIVYDTPLSGRKKQTDALDIGSFLKRLELFEQAERERLGGMKGELTNKKLERLADKCECIRVLATTQNNHAWQSDSVRTSDGLLMLIDRLFAKTEQEEEDICRAKIRDFVLLSSGHRVKGMEAKRIVVLRPDLLPHPMAKQEWEQVQEENIAYVIFTRSLSEIWVCGDLPQAFSPLTAGQFAGSERLPFNGITTDFGYRLGVDPLLNEVKPVQSTASSPKPTNETPEQIKKRYHHENVSTQRFKYKDRWEANQKAYDEVVEAEGGKFPETEIKKSDFGIKFGIGNIKKIVEATGQAKPRTTAKGNPRTVRGTKESGNLPVLRKEGRQTELGGILRKPPTRTSGEDEKVHGSVASRRSGQKNQGATIDRKEAGPKAEVGEVTKRIRQEQKGGTKAESKKAARKVVKQIVEKIKGRLAKPAAVKPGRTVEHRKPSKSADKRKAVRPVSYPEKSTPRKAVKEYGKTNKPKPKFGKAGTSRPATGRKGKPRRRSSFRH